MKCKSILLGVVALLAMTGWRMPYAYRVAGDNDTVSSVNTADSKFPQLRQEISYARMFDPELIAYLDTPGTVCTVIAPDNEAIKNTMEILGKFVGLFTQNQSMQRSVLNYHVIPGRALKAEDLGTNVTTTLTRANETLWFQQRGGWPYAYFRPDYVVPLEIVNIKAGGCILHVISAMLLIPPSLVPTFENWQQSAGTPSRALLNRSDWAPALPAAAGDVSAAASSATGPGPSTIENGAQPTAAAPATSAAPSTAARASSSASGCCSERLPWMVAVVLAVGLMLLVQWNEV